MAEAANRLLAALDEPQRRTACFGFDDPERFTWHYTPGPRAGLPLADMTAPQQAAAHRLLEAGLSERGARTARAVIDLETVLGVLEREAGHAGWQRRDPGLYHVSVFGDPAGDGPWAWRVNGHHLAVHLTVVGADVASTPLFFGANPARVPADGSRVLPAEEDLARELVTGLDDGERRRAVVTDDAPADILTRNAVRAEVNAVPTGIEYGALGTGAQRRLAALVDLYTTRAAVAPVVDLDDLRFAWAGSTTPGRGHYYAIRGTSFLVEYDNTQNGANHVHTVWRDTRGDWGTDLLEEHYRRSHP
jgi:hypothetical protein